MKAHQLLSLVAITAFAILQPVVQGDSLRCYECQNDECDNLTDEKLVECPPPSPGTSTTLEPIPGSSTTPDSASSSSTTSESTSNSSTTSDSTPSSSTSLEPNSSSSTTTQPTPGSSTTTESISSSSTTTEPTPGSSTTTKSTPGSSTTTESTPGSSTTTESTSSSSVTTNQDPIPGPGERRRRSLVDRFRGVRTYEENEIKWQCYSAKYELNGTMMVEKGCSFNGCNNILATPSMPEVDCTLCEDDKCNSASSNVLFTFTILSSLIVLLLTK